MFNAQNYAVRIEYKLHAHGLAAEHSADQIRRDPIGFMDVALSLYERQNEEYEFKAADFWDKYESYKGKRLDDFGEETAKHFVEDVIALFE